MPRGVREFSPGTRASADGQGPSGLLESAVMPIRSARDEQFMSFRTRLTGFFVLIVVVPMVAVGFLVFRLISDSEHGKADARASGLAAAAASLYNTESANAQADAQQVARVVGRAKPSALAREIAVLASRSG